MRKQRPPLAHVILVDGTFASLDPAQRSSIGRIYSALSGWWGRTPERVRVRYAPGMQWEKWRTLPDLIVGAELENHIRDAYSWLSNSWTDGDPIFLFGYSRGAFAVRSLAGMIGHLGLLRPESVTPERVLQAWTLYRDPSTQAERQAFRDAHCHQDVPIRMIGVFDTVMALGIRLPLLWMLTEPRFRFHDTRLGDHVDLGVQALALDETRAAFQPLLWANEDNDTRIRQMWFRGCHPDIGGQLSGYEQARPLANIPLVWMMHLAEGAGLPLPQGWEDRLPCDRSAPSVGSWRHWGKAFLARAPRVAGSTGSELLHPSVQLPYTGPALLTGPLARFAAQPIRQRRFRRAPRQAGTDSRDAANPPLK